MASFLLACTSICGTVQNLDFRAAKFRVWSLGFARSADRCLPGGALGQLLKDLDVCQLVLAQSARTGVGKRSGQDVKP